MSQFKNLKVQIELSARPGSPGVSVGRWGGEWILILLPPASVNYQKSLVFPSLSPFLLTVFFLEVLQVLHLKHCKLTILDMYTYVYIASFPDHFPFRSLQDIEYLYSDTLLFIHLICNSLHLLTSSIQSIPTPQLLGNHKVVLYVCMSVL